MRQLVIAAVVLAAVGAWAGTNAAEQATTAPSQNARAHARWHRLAEALGLTESQKSQIKAIIKNAHQQASATGADKRQIRKAAIAQIEATLTPEQVKKFQEIRAHWRAEHQGAGQQTHSGPSSTGT